MFYIGILHLSHWNLEIKLWFLHYCYPCPVTLAPFLLYCMLLFWASLHLASPGLTGLPCSDLGSCGGFPHRLRNEESWDLPWINFPTSELGPLHYAVVRPQGRNSGPAKETKNKIKGFENTCKYMKQFPFVLTFHKCFAMTLVNSQHVFASCSGEKCLADGFFLLI